MIGKNTQEFVDSLKQFSEPQEACFAVFDHLSNLMARRDYRECNALFENEDLKTLNITILVSLLMGTYLLASFLPARNRFLETVRQRIIDERVESSDKKLLLSRLR